jgi:hypothetical protein
MPATAGVRHPDAPAVTRVETGCMFSSPTLYRSGSRRVEVLPGESHSVAWAHVIRGGPPPDGSDRCDPVVGHVRRRVHRSSRRPSHPRRTLTVVA